MLYLTILFTSLDCTFIKAAAIIQLSKPSFSLSMHFTVNSLFVFLVSKNNSLGNKNVVVAVNKVK